MLFKIDRKSVLTEKQESNALSFGEMYCCNCQDIKDSRHVCVNGTTYSMQCNSCNYIEYHYCEIKPKHLLNLYNQGKTINDVRYELGVSYLDACKFEQWTLKTLRKNGIEVHESINHNFEQVFITRNDILSLKSKGYCLDQMHSSLMLSRRGYLSFWNWVKNVLENTLQM